MSADIVDIANVVDRRSMAIERKIQARKNHQKKRLSAIQDLELKRDACQEMIQDLAAKRDGELTAATLCGLSDDGIEYERILGEIRHNIAALRRDVEKLWAERKAQCDVLIRHKRKAEYMRGESAKQKRKAARRQFARDAADGGAIVSK
jgi:hypothetical protein